MKVLYFVDRLLWGGIQSLLYELITHINKEKFEIDILTLDDGNHYDLEDTIKNEGFKLFKLNGIWIRKPSDFIPYIRTVNTFFREHHDYQAVHLNSSSKNAYILYCAKKWNIPIRIAHSHNTGFQSKNLVNKAIGNIFKPILKKNATHLLACSTLAGEWLFGKDKRTKILKNGIDTEQFLFHEDWRKELRRQLGIENKFVVGCVGRFTYQKNHKLLICIFSEIKKKNPDSCLLLLGAGPLEEELKMQVHHLGLDQDVYFLGFRTDRNRWLSVMDAFVLTSDFEGLGIVLIEAQAAGLPTFAGRGAVPQEANISSLFHYESLNNNIDKWVSDILAAKGLSRKDMREAVVCSGYDIDAMITELEAIYLGKK
ncbi:MAG: glycosyltransferase family 1 protein [Prevotella sp.]|nr:glycosyltransferase family 1 protein [Prevotella sp.]